MIVLDTDHLSILQIPGSQRRMNLVARMALSTDPIIGTTIVNIEEQMRGWLAAIAKERLIQRQVKPYRELMDLFGFFSRFHILPFDAVASNLYPEFPTQVGAMDRKIAAITLCNNALLLTANHRDFSQIPGLRFENWMDSGL